MYHFRRLSLCSFFTLFLLWVGIFRTEASPRDESYTASKRTHKYGINGGFALAGGGPWFGVHYAIGIYKEIPLTNNKLFNADFQLGLGADGIAISESGEHLFFLAIPTVQLSYQGPKQKFIVSWEPKLLLNIQDVKGTVIGIKFRIGYKVLHSIFTVFFPLNAPPFGSMGLGLDL